MREAGQAFAFIVEDTKGALAAKRVPVTLGVLRGGEYVVVEGLQAGQRLVSTGLQMLQDGAPVQVAPK